jgi:hypothetical protein
MGADPAMKKNKLNQREFAKLHSTTRQHIYALRRAKRIFPAPVVGTRDSGRPEILFLKEAIILPARTKSGGDTPMHKLKRAMRKAAAAGSSDVS